MITIHLNEVIYSPAQLKRVKTPYVGKGNYVHNKLPDVDEQYRYRSYGEFSTNIGPFAEADGYYVFPDGKIFHLVDPGGHEDFAIHGLGFSNYVSAVENGYVRVFSYVSPFSTSKEVDFTIPKTASGLANLQDALSKTSGNYNYYNLEYAADNEFKPTAHFRSKQEFQNFIEQQYNMESVR